MFAAFHYAATSVERGDPTFTDEEKQKIAEESLDRAHETVQAVLNSGPQDEEMPVERLVLLVGRSLAEDLLLRVDPLLNPDLHDDQQSG